MKNRWKEFVFWLKCSPVIFWPQYWFHRAFTCAFGRHKFMVMYITDGSISVWCSWCQAVREPTKEEVATHPNLSRTPEQLAKDQATIKAALDHLDRRRQAP